MHSNETSSSVSLNSEPDHEEYRMSTRQNSTTNQKIKNRQIFRDLKKNLRHQGKHGNKDTPDEPLIPSSCGGCSSGNNSASLFNGPMEYENSSIHVKLTEIPDEYDTKQSEIHSQATNLTDSPKEQSISSPENYYKDMIRPVQALPEEDESWFRKCCPDYCTIS